MSNHQFIKRDPLLEIKNYIKEVYDELRATDITLKKSINETDFKSSLDRGLPFSKNQGRTLFIEDMWENFLLFKDMTKSESIRLQLEIVTTDMCRLFHVDKNTLRLLCTYQGRGTQWLLEEDVNYCALGKGDNSKIIKNPEKIRNAHEFDILIIQGSNYQHLGNKKALVHRSPPIEQWGEERILYKLDEAS